MSNSLLSLSKGGSDAQNLRKFDSFRTGYGRDGEWVQKTERALGAVDIGDLLGDIDTKGYDRTVEAEKSEATHLLEGKTLEVNWDEE